jgi:hypothetical protein
MTWFTPSPVPGRTFSTSARIWCAIAVRRAFGSRCVGTGGQLSLASPFGELTQLWLASRLGGPFHRSQSRGVHLIHAPVELFD